MRNLNVKIYYFIFLITLPLLTQAAPTPVNLSLKNAVDAVLTNNPSLRSLREKVRQIELNSSATNSILYPTIESVTTAYQKKDSVGSGSALMDGNSYNQYTSSIKLTQTIFKIGAFSALSSAQKNVEIGKLDADIGSRNLMSAVITGYYQIILNSKDVETLLHQQRLTKESLKVAEQRARIGRGQVLDVLQIKTQLALQESTIDEAKTRLQISIANLAFLMGDPNEQSIRINSSLDVPNIEDIDRAIDLKKYRIFELEKNELFLNQIEDLKRIAYGQNLPYLSLVGEYNFTTYKKDTLFDPLYNSWYLGIQLTIPIFSGFTSIYQQKQLSSQRIQFELNKKYDESSVKYQQLTSRKNLETAHNSISSGTDALKLSIDSLNEAKKNYKYAMIDFLHLLTVQKDYVTAEQTLNKRKFDYITALTTYFVSSGQDLNRLTALLERRNP